MLERRGHLAVISLGETLSDSRMTTFATTLNELADDDEIWVVALCGQSGQFGQDPEPPPAARPGQLALDHELAGEVLASRRQTGPDPLGVIRRFPKPILATLEGAVTGRGLAIALACDLRLATASTEFAFEEAGAAALPAPGVMQFLSRIVGPAFAMDLLLTGRRLSASEALAIGLVSRVDDDVAAATEHMLARLLDAAPLAMRFAKEAIRDGGELPLEAGIALELDLSLLLQLTNDRAEGLNAFSERRKPRFSGS